MNKPPLWINSTVDSWVTEKFPGAIRIARDCPPFAFGEDVAAVHPLLGVEFAREIITAYNEHDALCKIAEAAQGVLSRAQGRTVLGGSELKRQLEALAEVQKTPLTK